MLRVCEPVRYNSCISSGVRVYEPVQTPYTRTKDLVVLRLCQGLRSFFRNYQGLGFREIRQEYYNKLPRCFEFTAYFYTPKPTCSRSCMWTSILRKPKNIGFYGCRRLGFRGLRIQPNVDTPKLKAFQPGSIGA